jgi:hypothetical protein
MVGSPPRRLGPDSRLPLTRDPERGREELRGILGEKIKLRPDKSGSFLWAEYSLGLSALLLADTDQLPTQGSQLSR